MKLSGVGKRAAVLAAAALTAVTGVAVVGTGTADAARLPGGHTKAVGIDGQVVNISRSNESSRIMPSLAANGAGRAASASGTFKTTLSKGAGIMTVGYLVGCQINIEGLKGTLGASMTLDGSFKGTGAISVPLTPGQVAFVPVEKMALKKGKGTIVLDSVSIDVQLCGGYASARSVAQVIAAEGYKAEEGKLTGKSGYVQASLYGRPFSLG
ncbi:MspA family porin [Gordonia phthalatica]|uniref:MspA family protein n=1 Tax=Gordonia phthalatica TaxID=1136941 RepID=A0A0N9MP10_9ACTN|nr:MspA family porin [Gordonia phthalatica]ALG83882.1 hypothetical protein ACH46_04340 [Gordonia phthalatica]